MATKVLLDPKRVKVLQVATNPDGTKSVTFKILDEYRTSPQTAIIQAPPPGKRSAVVTFDASEEADGNLNWNASSAYIGERSFLGATPKGFHSKFRAELGRILAKAAS